MKKIKFNRFNIMIICGSLMLLLFFVFAYFNSYSEYVTKDNSHIDGNTIYINDLASDYYHYLGMNYVGDLYSNTVNYKDTDLKMVTINYYGYNTSNPDNVGYVSLTERQSKFVYYKYYPIKNGQITFDLIDNPFTDRPNKQGFAGWSSDVGTITTDSNTKIQKMTVSSSVDTINIYANWQKANVVYLNGETGNDNFDGETVYNAVGSWSKAFELLEQNTNDGDNREMNIIVLVGEMNDTINYSANITRTYSRNNYNYTDSNIFQNNTRYLLVYKNGNTRYALNDNNSNPGLVTLSTTSEPPYSTGWIIKQGDEGYIIQNEYTDRYLGYVQVNNDQVSLIISNTPYVWSYDTSLRAFFKEFSVTITRYTYTPSDTFTNDNNYIITSGNNALSGGSSFSNILIDEYTYDGNLDWKIESTGTDTYSIYNVNNAKYLSYNASNTNNFAYSNTPTSWIYDSANSDFHVSIHHRDVTYTYSENSSLQTGSRYFGYITNGTPHLLSYDGGIESKTFSSTNGPTEKELWEIRTSGTGYKLYNAESGLYLTRSGSTLTTTTSESSAITWTYSTYYGTFTTRYNNRNYYLYENGSTFALTSSTYYVDEMTTISVNENVNEYDETKYIAYNNGWKLENNNTNASLVFQTYTSESNTGDYPYYVRYDNNSNSFTIGTSDEGATLTFVTYTVDRVINNTNEGRFQANAYYSRTTNIAATITSLYNHIDYRDDATWNLTDASSNYAQIVAYNDLQLENLSINAEGYQAIDDDNAQTSFRTRYASIVGNAYNVRIGRGMTPSSWTDNSATTFCYGMGGSNNRTVGSTYDDDNAYRFVIESGRYSGLTLAQSYNNNSTAYSFYGQANMIMGNDYDRALNNNNNLDVYYRMASSTYQGVSGKSNVKDLAYLIDIKSGKFGINFFDNNPNNDSKAYAGIYVGGMVVSAGNSSRDASARVLVVEGGKIANINGGLRITEGDGDDGVPTKIYVKNGDIYNIVGGAGLSTTYGDRYISVTGGNVSYSVSGGSNGYLASGTGSDGKLSGDINVHIGGEAKIGTAGSGELYLVSYGSVLGAGNGNSNVNNSGQVNNSHVYISDKATIYGNVYGGGNFGPIAEDSNITIDGGTINGNVYGGANQGGVGTANITESTVYNVTYEDNKTLVSGQTYLIDKINGNTRNLLTENNQNTTNVISSDTAQPSTNSQWLINSSGSGYTIRNANSNRYLAYTTNSNPSLTTSATNANNIWKYDGTNKTFYSDIEYTVSTTVSYNYTTTITSGTEYVITNTNNNTAYSLNSDVSRVRLSTTTEPNENVWIFTSSGSGYTIRNKATGEYLGVEWGYLTTSNTQTVWTWNANQRRLSYSSGNGWNSTTYYLRYNNGWTVSTNNQSVYLATYNVNRVTNNERFYLTFDNTWKLSTTASPVSLSTFTSTSTTGYSVTNASDGDVTITMNDGLVKGAIYGGACEKGNVAGSVTININGGEINKDTENDGGVFGGGYGKSTFVANGVDINIRDTKNVTIDGTIYGGSALGTIIGTIDVSSIDNTGNGSINVTGDVYCGSMGDSDDDDTGVITGSCALSLDGGTYSGSVYGGNNANGSATGTIIVTTGGNNNTTISNVFGGGNQADCTAASVTVNIENNSNISNAYGGGNEAAVQTTNVNLHGGAATNIYGGSNKAGNIITSNITTTGGTATNIYGGNNLGGTTSTSNVNVNGGTITTVFGGGNEAETGHSNVTLTTGTVTNLYGGGNEAITNQSHVTLKGGTVTNTFGGGNNAGITTDTNISLEGSTCTKIYGGSNSSGDVPISNITATSGTADTIYGGNNVGGITSTTNVTISNITANNVYGGGCSADTGTNNVTINSGTITSVYGGGESASVSNNTNVTITGGNITNAFGGSNKLGTVPESNVHVTGGTTTTIYGGNNAGGTTTETNVIFDNGNVTSIYGGGSKANSGETNVTINNSTNTIANVFGGGQEADANKTNITVNGGTISTLYGGSNTSGTIGESNVIVNGGTNGTVYGGNNAGGTTTDAHVSLLGGTTTDVYGGGNNAPTTDAELIIDNANVSGNAYGGGNNAPVSNPVTVMVRNNATISGDVFGGGNNATVPQASLTIDNARVNGSAYGGGNNAAVNGNTDVIIRNNALVKTNVFGGGNNGTVEGSTDVNIINASINGSAYAGGNGNTAIVSNNTNITVQGNSNITNHVFGGGNAAATGNSASDNSHGTVNITGAIIGGNVYGGANTSVLYGDTEVNIGYDAVTRSSGSTNYEKAKIFIGGTVFGGGEANASGSEIYDFDFISVTKGIVINIDGHDYTAFDIRGSIFGSGNASRTTGTSNIYISNYGSSTDIKKNISLQRADTAVLNNCHMLLSGATDRTNEYSQVLFSLSRITQLDLTNNSEIYLQNGANLLNKFRSLDSMGNKAVVTIDENTHTVTRTTNNKVYMEEDKVLNIATNQNVTEYGEVDGMTFFGMFKLDRNGNVVTAMYNNNYETGDTPGEGELYYFSSGSYVLGAHETNHDIKVDGFYTNYDDPDNEGHILVDYIHPTPEDAEHYLWAIGVTVQSYDIELVASKYSTLGTNEFSFINNAKGNTTFSIVGFSYDDLDSNVSLINPDNIPRIASNPADADKNFGLAIKPGIGILTVGETYFLTDSDSLYRGTTNYKSENSTITPSLIFYLYHSKNLQEEGLVGNVTISVLAVTPINDLKNEIERINFNVTITKAIFNTTDYEGAMTPGRQYEMFTSSNMNITSKSSFSAYYSLYVDTDRTIYREGYYHALSSNVLLPVNTKITMIDFASATKPQYYYYIVNEEDNAILAQQLALTGEADYRLSNFIRMGSKSTNNKYDDSVANTIYYDDANHTVMEEFIFIVDFHDANITENMLNNSLLIQILDSDSNVLHSVLSIQRDDLVYNLYANQSSVVDVEAEVSKNILYLGETQDLRITTNFNQGDESSSNRIIDTTYYDQKLGLKISFFNERGVQVNGVDLMGTNLKLDGVNYYARSDGTFRFKISDRIANVFSNVKIDTTNSSLPSGNYTIRVEAFYSTDGIYYGTEPADVDEVTFRVMDKVYGLKVTVPDNEIIIDGITGKNLNGENEINLNIEYSGGLLEPTIKVVMYRRSYDTINDTRYNEVDISDYITNELEETSTECLYELFDEVNETNTYTFNLKDPIKTGTYKLEFRLYDGDSFVGEVFNYIIIK